MKMSDFDSMYKIVFSIFISNLVLLVCVVAFGFHFMGVLNHIDNSTGYTSTSTSSTSDSVLAIAIKQGALK